MSNKPTIRINPYFAVAIVLFIGVAIWSDLQPGVFLNVRVVLMVLGAGFLATGIAYEMIDHEDYF